ncbi:MAG: hypothetical protein R3F61_25735 [Myxococcota bacterium]
MSRSLVWCALVVVGCALPTSYTRNGGLEVVSSGRLDCVEGSMCAPVEVTAFPFVDRGDLAEAPQAAIRANGCDWDQRWEGGEVVYEIRTGLPGVLAVQLASGPGVQAFLLDHDAEDACVQVGPTVDAEVGPGTYWLLVDSEASVTDGTFDVQVDFRATSVPDDALEPNDTDEEAPEYWLGLFESHTIRATLTPASRLDWYALQVEAGAVFEVEVVNPMLELHVEDDDGEALEVHQDAEGRWTFGDAVHNRDRDYWLRLQLTEEQPDTAWTDYTLRIEATDTNPDAWD